MKFKKRIAVLALIIVNILIWNFYFTLPDGKLHIKILDVGQGDAIFIRTSKDFRILIDGGPNARVLDYLGKELPFYSRRLDLVVLTHSHEDHLNGLLAVVSRYQISTIWLNNEDEDKTENLRKLLDLIKKRNISYRKVYAGEKLNLTDQTKIEILNPRKGFSSSNPNLHSVVLKISYGIFDGLLTGDAEESVQPFETNSPVELFKVPHQGAKDSLNEDYISRIKPDISVISVGNNNYGHPAKETIDFLIQNRSKVYTTKSNGTIEIVTDGKNWYTKTQQ